jgi:hypothetical protein
MARHPRALALASLFPAVIAATSQPAGAQNLLANPEFNGLSSWTVPLGASTGADADGCDASQAGSMVRPCSGGMDYEEFSQCVAVPAQATKLHFRAKVDTSEVMTRVLGLKCAGFDDPGCANSNDYCATPVQFTTNGWYELRGSLEAAPGDHLPAYVKFVVYVEGFCDDLDMSVDRAYVGVADPILVDGFEGGLILVGGNVTPCRWSAVNPW